MTGGASSYESATHGHRHREPGLFGGIWTVGLGVLAGILVRSGERNEWIDVGDYLDVIRVCAKMIVVWCGDGMLE